MYVRTGYQNKVSILLLGVSVESKYRKESIDMNKYRKKSNE